MSTPVNHDETPLLPTQPVKRTPLPWSQFSIALSAEFAQSLTAQVISPFTPQLIRDIGITHGNEAHVAYYVGLMQSLFFSSEAITVLHWSRASDRIGRKPVMLTGLFGLSLSMYAFGLSKTFWGLVMSWGLNGALNGNTGPIKSIIAEITDETNISQAFAYFPLASYIALAVGPIIGGSLSRPAEQFPGLFGSNDFLKEYPYFLPCAASATFSVAVWLVVFFFLEETVKNPVPFFAPPRESFPEREDSSPLPVIPEFEKVLPLHALLTPRVIITASNYTFLSLVDISFRAILPVFLSTPIDLGGLGLSPSTIGNVLSAFGILNAISQVFLFARLNDHWGSKKTFMVGIATSLPMFACFPILSWLAKSEGLSMAVWGVVALQIGLTVGMGLSFGAISILIAASSPNKASLGSTNGLCLMTVNITRAIGPAAANSLYSLSMEKGYLGGYLIYYLLMVVTCVALFVGSLLPRKVWEY